MVEDNGPLMFINTVSTKIEENNEQDVYDSRYPKEKSLEEAEQNTEEEDLRNAKKLKNIVEMYQKGRPVYCKIACKEEEFEGIPFVKDDLKLGVYISLESIKEINIDDIKEITIIRF